MGRYHWRLFNRAIVHTKMLCRKSLLRVSIRWFSHINQKFYNTSHLNHQTWKYWSRKHLTIFVCKTPAQTLEDLRNRIIETCDTTRNTLRIFAHVRSSNRKRTEAFIEAGVVNFTIFLNSHYPVFLSVFVTLLLEIHIHSSDSVNVIKLPGSIILDTQKVGNKVFLKWKQLMMLVW